MLQKKKKMSVEFSLMINCWNKLTSYITFSNLNTESKNCVKSKLKRVLIQKVSEIQEPNICTSLLS